MTAIVILAAGGSSRLRHPKQLLSFKGESLLRRSARIAVESECKPVIVVLGFSAREMVSELKNLPVQVVINPEWGEGMASSLRTGLKAVPEEAAAVLLMLCDQPHVNTELLSRLNGKFLAGSPIVASRYRGVAGVPALFSREFFGNLSSLEGDQGARSVIQKYIEEVATIDFEEGAIDIDTEGDYSRLDHDC